MLREARRHQRSGESFAGIIYCHQLRITTGQAVRDLEVISKIYEPIDLLDRVEYSPL